jgi:hypothetical protein
MTQLQARATLAAVAPSPCNSMQLAQNDIYGRHRQVPHWSPSSLVMSVSHADRLGGASADLPFTFHGHMDHASWQEVEKRQLYCFIYVTLIISSCCTSSMYTHSPTTASTASPATLDFSCPRLLSALSTGRRLITVTVTIDNEHQLLGCKGAAGCRLPGPLHCLQLLLSSARPFEAQQCCQGLAAAFGWCRPHSS